MSQPITPVRVPYSDHTLIDMLDALKTNIMLSLNCHAIATVFEFTAQDGVTGRPKLSAQMAYSKTYLVQAADGTYSNKVVDYAGLIDCPAFFLGGSGTVLQMPPQPGDECLILFNDRDINNWWQGANTGPVASSRLHSFLDAIAIVGFGKWSVNDLAHAMLTNGDAQVGVGTTGGLVRIANNSATLNTLLGDLISAIKSITTTNAIPGVPCTISPASQAALTSIASQLSSLLE